ncbi:RNA-binding (RRM/RBD/RNP motifs) family protein [Striga hermonthica]|uniref:RNA-binding (RRM/RBD/RNP motifs) family protein n=1 Tax=Striga hermonthica TaxID=68872 RepID=A0A9N7MWR5_STRHE|nr:RNA-binding (RRM/RBD/RNP motifs) family protein [Striga hermonthica]
MTRSHLRKEKSQSGYQVADDDHLEGTSARTRPLSYDDVMLIRNNKRGAAKVVASDPEDANIASGHDDHKKNCDIKEHHRETNEDSEPMVVRHTSNDSQKVRSQRKRDSNASMKSGKFVQDNDEGYRSRTFRLKSVWEKVDDSKRENEEENERGHQDNRRRDGPVGVDSHYGSNKRETRDSYKKDATSIRGRVRSKVDRQHLLDNENQVNRKRKTEQLMSGESEKEYKRWNEQGVIQTERLLTNRGREKAEKETRHRHHNEEDKTKSRHTSKRDVLERKDPELPRASIEESRAKRRRSRSRERVKDRGRRSRSHSPKTHKHTSKDKREHGELSSHSSKDRSGRERSDIDKKLIPTCGSNSLNRRNTEPSSGLGGYSPRKRKTDAAGRTPSPTRRSPERRTAGWDLQPAQKDTFVASSALPNLQLLPPSQNVALNVMNFQSVIPMAPTFVRPTVVSHQNMSSQMHAIEAVQLTQATRPMRRLYVENIPSSASEKDLIDIINKYLLTSGVNYVRGTQPCISCIIHKEKSQALLEFLTPEDATSALSLDGVSFSGCNLKLRRPKDFASVTTGLSDKSVVAADWISNVVEDSPHKIFIGGISKLVSSKMLLEIARAFGPVKAFRFEFIADRNEPCAFLEYVDHSVTSKACAGLNGMKLGGRVVSAVFATPETNMENIGKLPFYGIPEHAKPLLEEPTAVLKLKNLLDLEGLSSLSESDLEDILEDIRLECSRFGTVKSINVAKPTKPTVCTMEAREVKNTSVSTELYNVEVASRSTRTEHTCKIIDRVGELDQSEPTVTRTGFENNKRTVSSDETIASNVEKDKVCKRPSPDENNSVKEPLSQEYSRSSNGDPADEEYDSPMEFKNEDKVAGCVSKIKTSMEIESLTEGDLQSEEEHDAKTRRSLSTIQHLALTKQPLPPSHFTCVLTANPCRGNLRPEVLRAAIAASFKAMRCHHRDPPTPQPRSKQPRPAFWQPPIFPDGEGKRRGSSTVSSVGQRSPRPLLRVNRHRGYLLASGVLDLF